jgi:hypothetical protein
VQRVEVIGGESLQDLLEQSRSAKSGS